MTILKSDSPRRPTGTSSGRACPSMRGPCDGRPPIAIGIPSAALRDERTGGSYVEIKPVA
jgi:hypothetical protein